MRTNEERLRRIGRRTAQLRRARQRRRQRALDAVCVGACLLLVAALGLAMPGWTAQPAAAGSTRRWATS